MTTQKTANQLYKESGSTLSFKDWIEEEKKKVKIPNVHANAEMMNMVGNEKNNVLKNVLFISIATILVIAIIRKHKTVIEA